jgi:hypothetical protein
VDVGLLMVVWLDWVASLILTCCCCCRGWAGGVAAGVDLGEGLLSWVELVGVLLCRLARVCVGSIGKGGGVCQSCYTFDMGGGWLSSLIKGGWLLRR